MKKSTAAFMISAAAMANRFFRPKVVSIPSCVVISPAEHGTWSKRDMQRMKGKAARKNRGRNRGKYDV